MNTEHYQAIIDIASRYADMERQRNQQSAEASKLLSQTLANFPTAPGYPSGLKTDISFFVDLKRKEWFVNFYKDLTVLGVDHLLVSAERKDFSDAYLASLIPKRPKPTGKTVSIQSFSILELNNLYLQALLRIYPEKENWGNWGAYYLVKGMVTGELKAYLYSQLCQSSDTDPKPASEIQPDHERFLSIWTVIKRFGNMLFGMASPNKPEVYFDYKIDQIEFQSVVNKIVDEYIQESGLSEHLIAVETDSILFDKYSEETSKLFLKRPVSQAVYNNPNLPGWRPSQLRELNRICRKYCITIVD